MNGSDSCNHLSSDSSNVLVRYSDPQWRGRGIRDDHSDLA